MLVQVDCLLALVICFHRLVEDRIGYFLDSIFTLIAWISVSRVATVWTRSSEVAGELPLGDEFTDAAAVVCGE